MTYQDLMEKLNQADKDDFIYNDRLGTYTYKHDLDIRIEHRRDEDVVYQWEAVPDWAKELKEIIQDQIDTNLTLSLTEISESLNVHPSYLSREFSKYFDNLSFGDYIRKLRIEKSIDLLKDPKYSLAEIAYLTGFSDQSHFTRIFKKQSGESPAVFRKKLIKK